MASWGFSIVEKPWERAGPLKKRLKNDHHLNEANGLSWMKNCSFSSAHFF
jgi:hypothetical protein